MTTVLTEPAGDAPAAARWRDLAAAVSLANLCFYRFWHTILFATPLLAPVWTWRDLLAIAVNVCGLAAVFWVAIQAGKRSRRFSGWHRGLYLIAPLVLLRVVELRYARPFAHLWEHVKADAVLILASFVAALGTAYALVRWRRWLLPAAEVLTLCLAAFVPVTFFQAVWVVYGDIEVRKGGLTASAPLLPLRPGQPRVVWIIYDEMDWRYVFPRRPGSLAMPEMDRLRAQSIYAESTFQTGLETSEAMMSYLAGRQVFTVEPTGKATVRLFFLEEPRQADWPGPPNLFTRARDAGFNTAMVGWFLPYCRLFERELSRCHWESMATRVGDSEPSLATSLGSQLQTLSPLEVRQRYLQQHITMQEEARRAVADPRLGLVVLHLAVPHEPAIYRRDRAELTLFNFRPDWYFDNLALADRALGDLRREMEQAGLWDSSTVIVTSDHPLRWYAMLDESVDPRVPLLVKMAGQKEALVYRQQVRSLVAHELALAVLRGETSRPGEVTHWLDQRTAKLPPGIAALDRALPGAPK